MRKPGPWWKEKARARRDLQASLFDLQFDDFSCGIPEPIEKLRPPTTREGVLRSIPVSAGIVTGRARVINSLSDAEALAPGEIMIASYIDVGWTPYFSSISGLVTEIGSTLSHGAVVAREYGIPAIVSVRGVKDHIRTGDTLTIDEKKGIITICRRANGFSGCASRSAREMPEAPPPLRPWRTRGRQCRKDAPGDARWSAWR